MKMEDVEWLNEIGENDVELVGGKAANLGILFNNNFPVPEGFVVTTGIFEDFLTEAGIKEEITNHLAQLDVDDYEKLDQVSGDIENLFLNSAIPTTVSESIGQAYKDLGEEAVVCRSSSTFEDSMRASFAGQHETFVNVKTIDEVINSVKKCWASLYTSRVLAYAEQKGIEIENAQMAVIIQRMINSQKSGVMFTSHPNKGSEFLLIESNWGLGESVVSGGVTPDKYVVEKDSLELISKEISDKSEMQVTKNSGSTKVQKTPSQQQDESSLKDGEAVQLAKIGVEIEELFNQSQDIEWAFESDEVRILQTRSITG